MPGEGQGGEGVAGAVAEAEPPKRGADIAQRPPAWAWAALVVAVAACSSGGVWFALMSDSPGIMRASWRMQLTFVLQVPGLVMDWRHADVALRARWKASLPKMIMAGLALAGHFSAWSLSLVYTSLSDSLLFVTTTPILFVLYQGMGWMIFYLASCVPNVFVPPTSLEVLGVLVGFGAATMLALGDTASPGSSNVAPSPGGDALALLGAAMMAIYLKIGSSLRQFLPIWMYAAPVTFFGAFFCAVLSLGIEGTQGSQIFSYLHVASLFGLVFASAATAGILGHTLVNMSIKYISPLIVSIMLLMEPIVGSVFGYFAGVQDPPSVIVYCAGLPLILSVALVISGARGQPLHRRCCSSNAQKTNRENIVVADEVI